MYIKPTKEQIEELYINKNNGSNKVGEILGVAGSTILKLLDEYNIPKKKKGTNVKYHANHSFFSTWSIPMAYCLGFIAADGHVWKDRPFLTIGINKSDENVLKYIRDSISPDTKIRYSRHLAQVNIYSEQIWNDLKKYGISHGKTFGFKIDFDIPETFWPHYLRGFFDGDGSIHQKTYRNKPNYILYKSSIVGACLQPLEYFRDRLCFGKIRLIRDKYYELGFNQQETSKLGNIMYKDKNSFKMIRKYEKFKLIQPKNKNGILFSC